MPCTYEGGPPIERTFCHCGASTIEVALAVVGLVCGCLADARERSSVSRRVRWTAALQEACCGAPAPGRVDRIDGRGCG
jgi:hypothetical protein